MKRNPLLYALAVVACAAVTGSAFAVNLGSSGVFSPDRSAASDRSNPDSMNRNDSSYSNRDSASDRSASSGSSWRDAAITTKVKAALLAEPNLKSTDIKVETENGVVQLNGFVTSRDDMDHAVSVARNVEDVKAVQNNLQTKGGTYDQQNRDRPYRDQQYRYPQDRDQPNR